MAYSVGSAFVTITPSFRGFQTRVGAGMSTPLIRASEKAGDESGKRFSSRFGSGLKTLGGIAAGALAVGALVKVGKAAVSLEAQFSKTMNVLQATSGATGKQMQSLSDLAIKMGADTVFSANDASKAMLELARGGIRPAQIQAGALKGTLTLAAAGELEMGEAANTAVKAMGAFNLHGKDMGAIAAALAGGANASSASVRDMSMALAQGGLAASNAGLSIQETTAVLAAFSNAGMEGSDAGTSLKTMLVNLQPATKSAREAFKAMGLETDAFVKKNGEFKSAAQIAGTLHKATEGLTNAERTRMLVQAFGTDAQRAANVLATQGAEGIRRLTKQTSDQAAAQKMAAANMKGTAGAIEAFKGSVETVMLQLGRLLAPAVQHGLRFLTDGINGIVPAFTKVSNIFRGGGPGGGALASFGDQIKATGATLATFGRQILPVFVDFGRNLARTVGPSVAFLSDKVANDLLPAFRNILPVVTPVAKFLLQMFGDAVIGAIKGAVQAIGGLIDVISGVFNLVSDLIHGRWGKLWGDFGQILKGALNLVIGLFKVWWNVQIFAIFRHGILALLKSWKGLGDSLRSLGKKALDAVQKVFDVAFSAVGRLLTGAIKAYVGLWRGLFRGLLDLATNGWRVLRSAFGGFFAAVRTVISEAVSKYIGFWRNLFDTLKSVASKGMDVVKGGISKALDAVRNAFDRAVAAIGRIWNGLKAAAAAPVRFVIDTVYNNGIRKVVNAIPGVPNLDPISFGGATRAAAGASFVGGHAAPTGAFANGGVLPGWSPGRDIHRFYSPTGGSLALSGGEAFMRPEFTRAAGGKRGIDRLNKLAREGRLVVDPSAEERAHHFANGGVFENPSGRTTMDGKAISRIAAAQIKLAEQIANVNFHIMQGGFGGSHIAASGSSHNYPGVADLSPASISLERVLRQVGFAAWARNIAGRSSVGSGAHIHAVSLLDPADRRSPQVYGSWANHGNGLSGYNNDPAPHYPWIANLRERLGASNLTGVSGGGGGVGGFLSGLWDKVQGLVGGLPGKISGWASHLTGMGGWGGLMAQMVKSVGGNVVDWAKDKVGNALSDIGSGFVGGSVPKGPIVDMVRAFASQKGWGSGPQWAALSQLISHESGWSNTAQNPTSTAYGLFQFLDSTWATVGGHKTSNPQLQIPYGLNYITQKYGTPVGAWNFWKSHNWYDNGGVLPPGPSLVYNGTGKNEMVRTRREEDGLQKGVREVRDQLRTIWNGIRQAPVFKVPRGARQVEKADREVRRLHLLYAEDMGRRLHLELNNGAAYNVRGRQIEKADRRVKRTRVLYTETLNNGALYWELNNGATFQSMPGRSMSRNHKELRDELRKANNSLKETRDRLTAIRDQTRDFKSALQGFKTDPFENNFTVQGAMTSLRMDTRNARRFHRAARNAKKLGLSGPALSAILASGNTTLLEALDTPGEISALEAAWRARNKATSNLSGFTSPGEVKAAQKRVKHLEELVQELRHELKGLPPKMQQAVQAGAEKGTDKTRKHDQQKRRQAANRAGAAA